MTKAPFKRIVRRFFAGNPIQTPCEQLECGHYHFPTRPDWLGAGRRERRRCEKCKPKIEPTPVNGETFTLPNAANTETTDERQG